VKEVVLLGDVKHMFGEIPWQEWRSVLALFDYLGKRCNKIIIVKGNHDVLLEPIVEKNENVVLKDYYKIGDICFFHGNKDYKKIHDDNIKIWIMGHAHPAIKISDGVKIEKYKCFLVGKYRGKKVIIVPSFLLYNEGQDLRESVMKLKWDFKLKKFNVKVSGENLEVLDFGKLGKV